MVMNHAKQLRARMEEESPLSEDILLEIMVYLPIKSLMRFRSISKCWGTLIKSSDFISRHLQRDGKESIMVKRYLPPRDIDADEAGGDDILSFHDPNCPDVLTSPSVSIPLLKYVNGHQWINLFGPCNGLICLVTGEIVVLCNPALREFELIAPSPVACPEDYVARVDGSGFGFDQNTNSYKVIQVWDIVEARADYYHMDTYMRIDLYDSTTNSWKILDVEVPPIRYDPGFSLNFNGICHWQANEFIEGPPAMAIILTFDPSTEVFQQFEFPDWFDDWKCRGLAVIDDCLALVRYKRYSNEPYLIDIWIMKEYGIKESWTREFVIGPSSFRCPLLGWRNEWLLVESYERQLASIYLHTNEMKRFQLHGLQSSFRALILKESLVSVKQVHKKYSNSLIRRD